MQYSQETGRKFWHDFEYHFRFDAANNGLLGIYKDLGGEDAASDAWSRARRSSNTAEFAEFVASKKSAIAHLVQAQKKFFQDALPQNEAITAAFQDFAFGVLESPDAQHRADAKDTSHTMGGGVEAQGYLHWNGFIEAALLVDDDTEFWRTLQMANGMAWELHVKAHPGEDGADAYSRLPDAETDLIQKDWFSKSPEEIAVEFDNYENRAKDWCS